jgi:Ca-activated chloride channel family protein
MSAGPKIAAVLVAGWLAQALASTDTDIDAGVEAYEASEFETALSHFDAARDRLGERPEIALDRGLALLRLEKPDEARTAFERATEAEDGALRASAFYELGNLDFDAESYEPAIARYIDALKANPLHANAKWNLELALLKKKEQDEQEEEEEQDENEEEQDEGEENEEEQDEGEENEEEQDEGEENEEERDEGEEGEEEQDEGEENEQDEGEQEQEDEGEPDPPEDGEDEQPPPEDGEDGEQEQPQPEDGEQQPPPPAEPKPVDRMDMQRALEQLDEQDPFTLDKPQGGYVQPEKDW